MPAPSEAPLGGLGRLALAALAFEVLAPTILLDAVAPVALVAVPLAALLVVSRPRSPAETFFTGLALGVAVWWLVRPGGLSVQVLKAGAVMAATVFVIGSVRTRASFTTRVLVAVTTAAVGASALLVALGSSWAELRWWVEHRIGPAVRSASTMWGLLLGSDGAQGAAARLETGFTTMVHVTADFYPAIAAIEIAIGLALATAMYHRVARNPRGLPLSRFRLFRFSEHLGWAVVIPLVIVLVPKLAALKLTAANVLVMAGVLYAVRGAAVAAFGLGLAGGGGFFLWVLLGVIFVAMLPVVVGAAIVLGVLDTGVDFRRRWMTPRVGN
jgi:hypothetical protein